MKPFLAASLALNIALAGFAAWWLLDRPVTRPAGNASAPASSPFQTTSASSLTAPAPAVLQAISQPPATAVPPEPAVETVQPPATYTANIPTRPNILAPSFDSAPVAAPLADTRAATVASTSDTSATTSARSVVNPNAPGNSLHFQGFRVAVAEAFPDSAKGTSLAVDVTPNTSTSDTAPAAGAGASPSTATAVSAPGAHNSTEADPSSSTPSLQATSTGGKSDGDLTQDDELFRAKWGWDAFDAAREEAHLEQLRKQYGKKK